MKVLTLAATLFVEGVNFCEGQKAAANGPGYPILWRGGRGRPDVAVNEAAYASSQRFGRDSFQTRSEA
jgi:hypothetical protein